MRDALQTGDDVVGLDALFKKEHFAGHVLKIVLADIEVARDGNDQVAALRSAQFLQFSTQVFRPPIAHDFKERRAPVGMAEGEVGDHHGLF